MNIFSSIIENKIEDDVDKIYKTQQIILYLHIE